MLYCTSAAYLFVPMHCYLEFPDGTTLTYDDDGPDNVHRDFLTDSWLEYKHRVPLVGPCTEDRIRENINACDGRDYRFFSHNCCDCLRIALANSGCHVPAGLKMVNYGF
jgi:hypothetical protein